jgi:hypothetical protein
MKEVSITMNHWGCCQSSPIAKVLYTYSTQHFITSDRRQLLDLSFSNEPTDTKRLFWTEPTANSNSALPKQYNGTLHIFTKNVLLQFDDEQQTTMAKRLRFRLFAKKTVTFVLTAMNHLLDRDAYLNCFIRFTFDRNIADYVVKSAQINAQFR